MKDEMRDEGWEMKDENEMKDEKRRLTLTTTLKNGAYTYDRRHSTIIRPHGRRHRGRTQNHHKSKWKSTSNWRRLDFNILVNLLNNGIDSCRNYTWWRVVISGEQPQIFSVQTEIKRSGYREVSGTCDRLHSGGWTVKILLKCVKCI
jgi:hypothetical protein